MSDLEITQKSGGFIIQVKIVPGASRSSIAGTLENMLKVRISAPPEKGKANRELINFLSRILKIRKKSIQIISGLTRPVKKLQISDITADNFLKKMKKAGL